MVDFGNPTKDRWVCPNDRQLALRAKLKTGWSVKTGSLHGYNQQQVPAPLNDVEQQTIKEVIKRAEVLEITEQERVGKLVDRLDAMKKNAVGNGTSQCVLCGDQFGMLGSQSLLCHDCKKLVCSKCGIDTFTAQKEAISLCKICSETREMWKKSGAWFFKGLPKYTLPVKKGLEAGKYGPRRIQRPGIDKNSWSKSGQALASKVSEEDESSSEDDIMRRQVRTRPSLDEVDAAPRAVKLVTFDLSSVQVEPVCELREPTEREYSEDRTGSREYFRQEDVTGSSQSLTSNYSSPYHRNEPSGWQPDSDSTHGHRVPSPFRAEQTNHSARSVSPYRLPHSRRDSQLSQVSREWSGSEDRLSLASGSMISVANNSVDFDDTANSHDNNAQLGTLELSLLYDPMSMVLHCSLHRAKGLKAMDINGLSDPFCRIDLLPNEGKSNRLRTKTVHKTRNPEFNETLTFYGVTEHDMTRKLLHIQILDDDKYGNDFIGEARIMLSRVSGEISRYLNVFLEERCPVLAAQEENDCVTRGQILVTLCYSTRKRALVVGISRCVNLTPMDNNGLSDPFVKLRLKPDSHRRKYKTSVKWKNLNPTFNEEFVFDTKMTDLPRQALELTVWDKDYGKSNDYLGGLQLGWNSKGERLRHWVDMIKFPDHKHEGWHNLSEHLLTD